MHQQSVIDVCCGSRMMWFNRQDPRTGDTVRLVDDRYAKVTEVIWCYDEDDTGQRVNIRMESEQATQAAKGE